MSREKVYLAGPVQHADDNGNGWRDYLMANSDDFDWQNPLDEYEVQLDDVRMVEEYPRAGDNDVTYITFEDLVASDKEMVDEADAMLVGWGRVPSVGTPMEMMYAHNMADFGEVIHAYREEIPDYRLIGMAKQYGSEEAAQLVRTLISLWDAECPIVAWMEPRGSTGDVEVDNLSPWLRYHAEEIVGSPRGAVKALGEVLKE